MNQTTCHCHAAGRTGMAAWMEIVTLLLLATFLAYSYFAGKLGAFVAPGYIWLTPAAALALAAMFLARLLAALGGGRSEHGHEHPAGGACDHSHAGGDHGGHLPLAALAVVLLAPIVLALWVNPQQLSAEGARKRRVPTPPRNVKLEKAFAWVLGLAAAEKDADAAAPTLPKDPSVLDLLTAVEEGRGGAIEGQFVTVFGQCDLRSGRGDGRFDLYRLVITCCIADATSVSVEVAPSAGFRLEPSGWVRVGGIVKFDSPLDPALPVVHAATIAKISEPNKPYL
jgi:uncharacterized repeat protein (TIGR03943 family)